MARIAITALALLAAIAVSAPSAAAQATISTVTRCYPEAQEVILNGAGFAPLSAVTISRDGRALGTALADANGAFRNKFETPKLPDDVRERLYELSATDATSTAMTTYRAARIFAAFRPRRGNPATLRVRFSVFGFGLVRRRPSVYLHYVRPSGKAARTIRLGTARGACGTIEQTPPRRLFPFDAEQGVWILQFDTRRKYERATSRRRTPWVRKPVEIFTRPG